MTAHPHPQSLPRVVLDTNILVAYALSGDAPARRGTDVRDSVEAVRSGGVLLLSADTLAELHRVLMRPAFDRYRSAAARAAFLDGVAAEARMVVPAAVGRLCRDPDDDMFLAVALAADADWLVTMDQRLLAVGGIGRTRVLRPARFLEQWAGA